MSYLASLNTVEYVYKEDLPQPENILVSVTSTQKNQTRSLDDAVKTTENTAEPNSCNSDTMPVESNPTNQTIEDTETLLDKNLVISDSLVTDVVSLSEHISTIEKPPVSLDEAVETTENIVTQKEVAKMSAEANSVNSLQVVQMASIKGEDVTMTEPDSLSTGVISVDDSSLNHPEEATDRIKGIEETILHDLAEFLATEPHHNQDSECIEISSSCDEHTQFDADKPIEVHLKRIKIEESVSTHSPDKKPRLSEGMSNEGNKFIYFNGVWHSIV